MRDIQKMDTKNICKTTLPVNYFSSLKNKNGNIEENMNSSQLRVMLLKNLQKAEKNQTLENTILINNGSALGGRAGEGKTFLT